MSGSSNLNKKTLGLSLITRSLFVALASILLTPLPQAQAQSAVRFSGGSCVSQGDWVQGALAQSAQIVSAIEALRDDPNCQALVKSLDNSAQLKELSQAGTGDVTGMAGVYNELQSISSYLGPQGKSAGENQNFREIVNYLVFRKSLDTINNIYIKRQYESLTQEQKMTVDITSQRLRNFLERSGTVSNVAVATAKGIMSALPQSQLCFQDRPSEAGLIFSSIVSSAASLASGGQISNVGEMVSTLVNFNRQMKLAKILRGAELERYRASVSCLVESTQEAYCSLQDAQDSLNFIRGTTGAGKNLKMPLDDSSGTIENPMQGLLVLLRDIPVITAWLQKILFGIDPQLQVEAEMKNANWESVVNFIKSANTLPATFRDKRKFYYDSSVGQDNQNKAAMIRDIIFALVGEMDKGSEQANTINFFTASMNSERMPFFLMGVEVPPEYNSKTNPFSNIYIGWTRDGSHGLGNPDALIETIGERLNLIIDKASSISSSYFGSRMIVDPQNLMVEGMNGPAIGPYKALFNVRTYLYRVITKLQAGMKNKSVASNEQNLMIYQSTIPMLQDTIARLDRIINAMSDIAKNNVSQSDISANSRAARKAMDAIYEFANMLTSRDSFLATRMANAVRLDITDTLWRNESLSESQDQLMRVLGKDIVTRLSQYVTRDPVLQRLDVAQAAPIHMQNLVAVEQLFVPIYWSQILDINCKLFGGKFCALGAVAPSPDQGMFSDPVGYAYDMLTFRATRTYVKSLFTGPTEDSQTIFDQRARLCVQTLSFPNYHKVFEPYCRGSVLISEFSGKDDTQGLNLSYDKVFADMQKERKSAAQGSISKSRAIGVCALRSYIRRNTVYRMYTDLQDQQ